MTRGISALLGIGVAILFIAGLSTTGSAGWMTWLDLVAAVAGLALAAAPTLPENRNLRIGGPVAIGIGLAVLWILGLASHLPSGLSWWNFVFACAFVLLGIADTGRRSSAEPRLHVRNAA